MRWQGRRQSSNVEDRRGGPGVAAAGGGMGCLTIVVALIYLFMGGDPRVVQQVLETQQAQQPPPSNRSPVQADDPHKQFIAVVLGDTEQVWGELFRQSGSRYPEPKLVLFEDLVASACGRTSASVGPFYCPADQKVYIDLSFFRQLDRRFGAPGDFAQAYVVAHEVGHHVQNVLGTMRKVSAQQRRMSKVDANVLSVALELQADCYAGVWAHHAHTQRQLLEAGDVEEGLRAAAAIGDDALQKMSQGYVQPEAWTHGSSKQRVTWFQRGLKTGDPNQCDTFSP